MRKRSHSAGKQVTEKNIENKQEFQQTQKRDTEMKSECQRMIMRIKKFDSGQELLENSRLVKQDSKKSENPDISDDQQPPESFFLLNYKEEEKDNAQTNPCKLKTLSKSTQKLPEIQSTQQKKELDKKENIAQSLLISKLETKKQPGILKSVLATGKSLLSNIPSTSFNIPSKSQSQPKPQSLFREYFDDFMEATFNSRLMSFFHKKPENQKNQNENDVEAELEAEVEAEVEIDPPKSTGNYQYENCIFRQMGKKWKKNDGSLMQAVEIIIQTEDIQPQKINWITINAQATKLPLFIGFIVKDKTTIKHFGDKEENVVLTVIQKQEFTSMSTVLKLQFESKEKAKIFVKIVKTLLS